MMGSFSSVKRSKVSVSLSLVAALVLLAACSGKTNSPAPAAPSAPGTPSAQPAPAKESELILSSWGGAADETFKKAFKPFEEKFGAKVKFVAGNSAENLAKAVATAAKPEYDVVLVENTNHFSGSEKGVWEKLDPAVVTNLKSVYPQAIAPNSDGVGFGFIATGLFYKTDEFKKNNWAPPTSWEDLFRPEFCGRVGMLHPNVTYSLYAAWMLSGGDDLSTMEQGLKRVATLSKCIPVLEPSSPKLEEKIQLGEYLIGVHGSFRVMPLTLKGYPVQFVYPKEGSVLMLSMVAPVKNAPHPKLAQEFVNWFIAPETQQILMNDLQYGPVNSTVTVPDNLKQIGVADVEVVKKLRRVNEKTVNDNRAKWTEAFDRMIAK